MKNKYFTEKEVQGAKLIKVSASGLLEGMILKNGGGVVKNTSRGLRTPKGKIDVVISWPNGLTKIHTWSNSTQILVSAH